MFIKIKKEHIDFIIKMEENPKNNLKVLAYPIFMTSDVVWECKDCGKINKSNFGSAFRKGLNRRCKFCGKVSNKYTIKDANEIFKERGYILLDEEYINCKVKMKYHCPKCNTNQSMSLDNMKRGKGCRSCSRLSMMADERMKDKCKELDLELIKIDREHRNGMSDNINLFFKVLKRT